MNNNFLDNFIQVFSQMINQGLDRITTTSLLIATAFAAIDFAMMLIFEYANEFSQFFKKFLEKIINYSITFAIIKFYKVILNEITNIIFSIGYLFFDSTPRRGQFPSFDEIFNTFRINILNMEAERQTLSWSEIGTSLMYIVIMVIGMILIFLIIKEIIVNFLKFRIVGTLGVLLIPFAAFEKTKSIASKLWMALLQEGCILMVSIALTGVALRVMRGKEFVGNNGTVNIGNAIAWLFTFGLVAFLVTNSKQIGSALANGTSVGRTSSVIGSAVAMAVGGAVGAVAAGGATYAGAKGAFTKGKAAMEAGKNFRGVMNDLKRGAKEGIDAYSSTRTGKFAKMAGKGLSSAVGYATGAKRFSFSDLKGGLKNTADATLFHDKEANLQKFEKFQTAYAGKDKDYDSTSEFIKTPSIREAMKRGINSFKENNVDQSTFDKFKTAYNEFKEHRNTEKNYFDNVSKENKYNQAHNLRNKYKEYAHKSRFNKDKKFETNEWDYDPNKYHKKIKEFKDDE